MFRAHDALTGHDARRWSALGSGLFVTALAGRTRMHAAASYIARSNGNAGRRPRTLCRIGWLPARLWGAARSGARRFVCGKAVPKVEPGNRSVFARALVAGGLAGIVGGWAFGQWMEKAHFFPLIAGLVGSSSPGLGKTLHFFIAVIIGATFGLLFQRDVRGYGSSLGWGLAYGIFWWFLGPLTLKPLLRGHAPDWSLAQGQELFGSLMGHIVYGLIVGVIYAALDKLWVGFFIDSDPINRQPEGPGSRTLLSLGRGAMAGLIGGLVFWPQIVAVDGLPWIARLAGGTSPALGLAVHLTISVAIGAGYGVLFRARVAGLGRGHRLGDAIRDHLVVCRHVNSVPNLAGSFLHLDHRGGRQRALFTPRASDLRRGHGHRFPAARTSSSGLDAARPALCRARGAPPTPCWHTSPCALVFRARPRRAPADFIELTRPRCLLCKALAAILTFRRQAASYTAV